MNLPKELTTVTRLSKILVAILFVSLPFVGFFLGIRYQEMLNPTKNQQEESNLVIELKPTPTLIAIPTLDPSITANWKTHKDDPYKFEIKFPETWFKSTTSLYYPDSPIVA